MNLGATLSLVPNYPHEFFIAHAVELSGSRHSGVPVVCYICVIINPSIVYLNNMNHIILYFNHKVELCSQKLNNDEGIYGFNCIHELIDTSTVNHAN